MMSYVATKGAQYEGCACQARYRDTQYRKVWWDLRWCRSIRDNNAYKTTLIPVLESEIFITPIKLFFN